MFLNLHLSSLDDEEQMSFAKYILKVIQESIIDRFDKSKVFRLENFINDNKLIKFIRVDRFMSVFELYQLASTNLVLDHIDKDVIRIYVNDNINVPDSYTPLISLIKLLEFGNLSVGKYGLLTSIVDEIALNLDTYYNDFIMGVD